MLMRCWALGVWSVVAAASLAGSAFAQPVEVVSGDAGTIYGGAIAGQDWGRPLAAGDLNGDGFDEVVVSASESWGGVTSRVYVLRGGPHGHVLGSVDLSATGADQVIVGAEVDDNLGSSLATGDVNGDAIADLVMCASSADFGGLVDRGIAYVVFGDPNFFDVSERDLAVSGSWDMRILGPVAGGDMGGMNAFGGLDAQAAAVGYLNDDTYGDIALGVHLADGQSGGAGRAYILFGAPYGSGYTFNLAQSGSGFVRIDGAGEYDELGCVVAAGDLTGDGMDELILGVEYASQGLFTSEGAVYVLRGRATWPTQLYVSSNSDMKLLGVNGYDGLGEALAVGDFNGDAIMDLAAAAPGADAGQYTNQRGDGFVYGLLGSTAYQSGTYLIDYATATPDFLLIGEFEENLGTLVSAGDFDGDGIDDIAAAERFAGSNTNGVVEVLLGRDFTPGETFVATVDTDLRIVGAAQDRIGFSLAACNVNGDGVDEVLFGTPFNNSDRGTAYIYTYVSGDADADRDRDLADFVAFQACFHSAEGNCGVFDFNLNDALDAGDLEVWGERMTGPR